MAHQRQVIRHAIRDLLDGVTTAGTRVYATRVTPFRRNELPVISVYTLEESVTSESVNTFPRELTRELPVIIEGWVAPGDNPDDSMDALALEIETAMHADPYLDGEVAESILDSTAMEVLQKGDRLTGIVALTYQITYHTFAPVAPTDIDDFETVGATYNLGNEVHEDDDAHDVFDVEEDA
jgi:hypothetical protein